MLCVIYILMISVYRQFLEIQNESIINSINYVIYINVIYINDNYSKYFV